MAFYQDASLEGRESISTIIHFVRETRKWQIWAIFAEADTRLQPKQYPFYSQRARETISCLLAV